MSRVQVERTEGKYTKISITGEYTTIRIITLVQLANRMNLNQKVISLLESGLMKPDVERLLPLLVELDLELHIVEKVQNKPAATAW